MAARILFFVYGCAAYLLFLATFLYAIAFIGGFGVPVKLDGPATTPFLTALLIDTALLGCVRGSAQRDGAAVVQAMVDADGAVVDRALHVRVVCQPRARSVVLAMAAARRRGVGRSAAVAAHRDLGGVRVRWLQVLVMTFLIDHFDLFGLRQVWLHLIGRQYTRVKFATPAPYRMVRHPLYLGFMLAFWAAPTMSVTRLVFAIVTTAYMLIAIQFEEHDLTHEHGEDYRQYRRRVPMLVPGIGGRG